MDMVPVPSEVEQELAAAIFVAHETASELLDELQAKVDGLNVKDPNWGHVGDLNYVISQLKNALGQE